MSHNPVPVNSQIPSEYLNKPHALPRWQTVCVWGLTALLFGSLSSQVFGFKDSSLTPAPKMLNAETQAVFMLPNTKGFLDSFKRTELGKLAADPRLKPFWQGQRQEIQGRIQEAGLQLSLEFEELGELSSGQTAIAWILRPSIEAKPFSVALVVDIAGHDTQTQEFLKRVEAQLVAKGAALKKIDVNGAKVSQFVSPKVAGEPRVRESYYATSKDQLLATDDLETMKELVAAQDGSKTNSLANTPLFKSVQSKIKSEGDAPEVEYFVRPIGFAKLLRSISGKPSNNSADILKILESQGFEELQCFAGNIQISRDAFDFFHNGYILAKKPFSRSVQILDFPNAEQLSPPAWINPESASVLSFSWNAKDAFQKFDGIVDAYVGAGTFKAVIDQIRADANGPQIDIAKDILPYISSEFHVVTEIIKPIGPLSKRSMVILKLNDNDKKLAKVLDKFGKSEPHATPIDIEGYRVWRIKNDGEEAEISLEYQKGSDEKADEEEEEEDAPLLDQWAISIMDDYFIFASDAEMITDTIRKAKANQGAFMKQPDVAKLAAMLKNVSGNNTHSFQQMTRSDRAFEMQYEMFREGTLPDSKSMLATILDKILKPKGRPNQQKVNGAALPPFAMIRDYFMPSGGVVRTEEDGWSLQSFIQSKP